MRVYDLITKKKRGEALSDDEIRAFISGYVSGEIPDYQVSAMLMAICWRGMNERETAVLTDAITKSGDQIDLSEFGALSVDKHSTGGVGDKTTLIVAPIVASLGCYVAKMSGRGLGHTGGTVDKLESFPGYKTSLTPDEFFATVRKTGVAVIGQSGNLAPADKKLYALRDVTATIDTVPLIASSIMGKKLAAGAGTIVLDVKCGAGAFMKSIEDAEELADAMVKIAKSAGRRASALITNMDIPLGRAVGNILEVKEAIATLRGEGPADLLEVCLSLASEMVSLALGIEREEARCRAENALSSGLAYEKFLEWISAQGGDVTYAENPDKFKSPLYTLEVRSSRAGYISYMNAEGIGLSAMELGAGRRTKDDEIDFTAGIVLERKTGDRIEEGELLATLYTSTDGTLGRARDVFESSLEFSSEPIPTPTLIYKIIS